MVCVGLCWQDEEQDGSCWSLLWLCACWGAACPGPMGAVQHNAALEMESVVKSFFANCVAINDNYIKKKVWIMSSSGYQN